MNYKPGDRVSFSGRKSTAVTEPHWMKNRVGSRGYCHGETITGAVVRNMLVRARIRCDKGYTWIVEHSALTPIVQATEIQAIT